VWSTYGSKTADGRKTPFSMAGLTEEVAPDVWRPSSVKYRLEDMDRDNIYASVIYNFVSWTFENPELKGVCIHAFNDWTADFCSTPRLIGVGVLPTYDVVAAVNELRHTIDRGLRMVMFDMAGAAMPVHDRGWDPLWSLAEESGTIISVHIEANFPMPPRTKEFTAPTRQRTWLNTAGVAVTNLSLARVLADVTMCGLLERHQRLRFVLGESSIGWVPFVLERLDFECENYKNHATGLPKTKPSELFRRNMYCTFQYDKIGVSLIPELGEDNVMWAADYPHGDGTFPYSMKAVDEIFADSPARIRAKATRETAKALFNIQ
jgi:predicted TIM-barrel fold metal-dependent hydrolase